MLTLFLAALPFVSAVYQGFNYGPTYTDGSFLSQSDFQNEFSTAQSLVGTSGFSSARLYTMIQGGTTNTPTEAIPAAIATNTSLLLGLWASAGSTVFSNELAALTSAITQYGSDFTSLIAGISIGSEDLYRNSPMGIENLSGVGANPADIVDYITQVKSAISQTTASKALVGHVDTWTAWVNGSNSAVIDACDFVGMDAYPYFQNTVSNSISSASQVFFEAYNNTQGAAGSKPVWITETGWPVSGNTSNLAVPSVENAQTYWDTVGCAIFGKYNSWWFTLRDTYPTSPSPSFGIVGTQLSTTPLYNLTCPAVKPVEDSTTTNSSTETSASSSASASASSSEPGSSSGTVSSPSPKSTSGASRNVIAGSGVVAAMAVIALW
jgi:glucan endo-1,3-beta-D-glucosidase